MEENAYTITVYDVDYARRDTSFVDKAGKFKCSQGRDLRRLMNDQKLKIISTIP